MKMIRGAIRRASVGLASKPHRVWLFDLDNTLHNANTAIMPRVNRDMTAYVAQFLQVDHEQAQALRKQYWHQYGATLTGMQRLHDVDPHDFLRETHRFPDMAQIVLFRPALAAMLRRLQGPKVIVTNAPMEYAQRVLLHSGLSRSFDAVVSIEHMQFRGEWQPKPARPMLKRLLARLRVKPCDAVLIEDSVVNLHAAHACGVKGVWVRSMSFDRAWGPQRAGRGRKVSVQVQSVRQLLRLSF